MMRLRGFTWSACRRTGLFFGNLSERDLAQVREDEGASELFLCPVGTKANSISNVNQELLVYWTGQR